MAKFTLLEAAKLVKINRRTIYKHVKKGKVSISLDSMGKKCIDAAELHRAYGEFDVEEAEGTSGHKPKGTNGHTSNPTELEPMGTAGAQAIIEELRLLRNEVKQLRKEVSERPLLTHNPVATLTTSSPTEGRESVVNATETPQDVIKRLTTELGRRPTAAEIGKAIKKLKSDRVKTT